MLDRKGLKFGVTCWGQCPSSISCGLGVVLDCEGWNHPGCGTFTMCVMARELLVPGAV